jgi:hypothetical protein
MRSLLAALAATALVGLGPGAAALAAQEDDDGVTPDEAVTAAERWLGRQQQADGGFDGFLAGAGTPDTILALAESAQTESAWGNRPALERVESEVSAADHTPLDAARQIARRVNQPQVTARLITRVALPVGLEAGDEGPLGDLTGSASDWLEDDDTAFDARVELAIALVAVGAELPEGLVDEILAAQQANGGWNADGDADSVDLVTTGAVVDLLVLVGADTASGAIPAAMAFVGETRARNGAWPDPDGESSAVATAGAIRAIRADGHDPAGSCWLTEVGVEADATAPVAALIALQNDDGSFSGDNPVRATSDAVHALSGRWLPLGRASDACAPESGGLPFAPSLIVLVLIVVVGVGGGVRIMRGGPSAV